MTVPLPLDRSIAMLDLRGSTLTVMGDSHLNQVREAFPIPGNMVGLYLRRLLTLLEVPGVSVSNEVAALFLRLLVRVGSALCNSPLLLRCFHGVFFNS